MASKIPVIRQIAWLSVVPQLAIVALLVGGLHVAGVQRPFVPGAIAYLALALTLRTTIATPHRRGISLVRQGKYGEAIQYFQQSFDFFTRHKWVDDFRFLTMFSSARMSYREMALVNMAFCYSQTGDGRNAKQYYERVLSEFADNEIAKTSLRMIEAAEQNAQAPPTGNDAAEEETGP